MRSKGNKVPPLDVVAAARAIADSARVQSPGELPATIAHDRLVLGLRAFVAATAADRCSEAEIGAAAECLREVPDAVRPVVLGRLVDQLARVPNPNPGQIAALPLLARELADIALDRAAEAAQRGAWEEGLDWIRRGTVAACFIPEGDPRLSAMREEALGRLGRPESDARPKLGAVPGEPRLDEIPAALAAFCSSLLKEAGAVGNAIVEWRLPGLALQTEQAIAAQVTTMAPPLLAQAAARVVLRNEPFDVIESLLQTHASAVLAVATQRAAADVREIYLRSMREGALAQRAAQDVPRGEWRALQVPSSLAPVGGTALAEADSAASPPLAVPAGEVRSAATRVVRVFVSSTFHDHHAERDELVKRIFPQLRRMCEERDVAWAEVDLRWGISDEQAAEGRVLPICLAEIDRSRPFFVGLLGERYGRTLETISPAPLADYPWLDGMAGRSLTELEIIHGVLNNPSQAGGAFLYLRDPRFVDTLPATEQAQFLEQASDEEVARLGRPEAERWAADRRAKLAALKARVRACGRPVQGYLTARELGELVLRDLSRAIDERFPAAAVPGPLERATADQAAFRSRLAIAYAAPTDAFNQLNAHAAADGPPLIVAGGPGSGVSALLANWARWFASARAPDRQPNRRPRTGLARLTTSQGPRDRGQGTCVVSFAVGASNDSDDWAAVCRQVTWELNRHFELGIGIPEGRDAVVAALRHALEQASARERVVLILDGVDRLDDTDDARTLWWLPSPLPAGVRLVIGRRPWAPFDPMAALGWSVLAVPGLDHDARRQIAIDYLGRYGKTLDPALMQRLVGLEVTANPRVLRTLLEEARLHGAHATISQRIDDYAGPLGRATGLYALLDTVASPERLTGFVVEQLYAQVLSRLEHDLERDRPGLVCETLTRLWASRQGLAEADLVTLLGDGNNPLPSAQWSPLLLALEPWLLGYAGRIDIADPLLRAAVKKRYLGGEAGSDPAVAHLALADFFQHDPDTPAAFRELTWQLQQAGAWDRLFAFLAQLPTAAPYLTDADDLLRAWRVLETAHPELSMLRAYQPIIEDPASTPAARRWVARVLSLGGYTREALALEIALEEVPGPSDPAPRPTLLHQAEQMHQQGRLQEAQLLLGQQEALCQANDDTDGMIYVRLQQGALAESLGDLATARRRYREGERLARAAGDDGAAAIALGGQASAALQAGNLRDALQLADQQLSLGRQVGDRILLASALTARGRALHASGQLDAAVEALIEAERLARRAAPAQVLAQALFFQALARIDRGADRRVIELLDEVEEFGQRSGHDIMLWQCKMARAQALRRREPAAAARATAEAVAMARDIGLSELLVNALLLEAGVLADDLSQYHDALARLAEAQALAATHGPAELAKAIAQEMAAIRKST
jgi:tetratricopeptide (TPR) repeat protein